MALVFERGLLEVILRRIDYRRLIDHQRPSSRNLYLDGAIGLAIVPRARVNKQQYFANKGRSTTRTDKADERLETLHHLVRVPNVAVETLD
jgi:hypothetical protein